MNQADICFVSYGLYPYLRPGASENAGGAERQQYLLASELVKRGYEVSAVVGDYDQDVHEVIDQVNVWRTYKTVGSSGYKSISGFFRLPKQIIRLLSAMKKADAKVYYTRSSLYYPLLCFYSKFATCSYVCALSHDRDVERTSVNAMNPLFKKLYLHSLKAANRVISQTKYQKTKLKANYGIDSVIIPNGYKVPENAGEGSEYFLWVGRAVEDTKRPDLFLELSNCLPEETFVMIVSPGQDESYFRKLRSQARQIPNVHFEGFVPPDEVESYYRNAIALVNTSTSEGFPNTFLEAWCVGTPVVSLHVGLDGLLQKERIGIFSGNFKNLVQDTKRLADDRKSRRCLGYNARTYVESNHSIEKIVDKFEEYIL